MVATAKIKKWKNSPNLNQDQINFYFYVARNSLKQSYARVKSLLFKVFFSDQYKRGFKIQIKMYESPSLMTMLYFLIVYINSTRICFSSRKTSSYPSQSKPFYSQRSTSKRGKRFTRDPNLKSRRKRRSRRSRRPRSHLPSPWTSSTRWARIR